MRIRYRWTCIIILKREKKWGFLCTRALSLLNLTAEGFKIIDIRIPYFIDANC